MLNEELLEEAKYIIAGNYTSLLTRINNHADNEFVHICEHERDYWNSKADSLALQKLAELVSKKADVDDIPVKLSDLENDLGFITLDDVTSLINDNSYLTLEDIQDEYATKAWVQAQIDSLNINNDTSAYATYDNLNSAINNLKQYCDTTYATKAYVDEKLADIDAGGSGISDGQLLATLRINDDSKEIRYNRTTEYSIETPELDWNYTYSEAIGDDAITIGDLQIGDTTIAIKTPPATSEELQVPVIYTIVNINNGIQKDSSDKLKGSISWSVLKDGKEYMTSDQLTATIKISGTTINQSLMTYDSNMHAWKYTTTGQQVGSTSYGSIEMRSGNNIVTQCIFSIPSEVQSESSSEQQSVQRINGKILRITGEWSADRLYNDGKDEHKENGVAYVDVVSYAIQGDKPTYFMCTDADAIAAQSPHLPPYKKDNKGIRVTNLGWQLFNKFGSIQVDAIIGEMANFETFVAKEVIVRSDQNIVEAGIVGSDRFIPSGQTTNEWRIFAGIQNDNIAESKFRVNSLGKMVATDAEVTGEINATSGQFENITVTNATLTNCQISGTLSYDALFGKVYTMSDSNGQIQTIPDDAYYVMVSDPNMQMVLKLPANPREGQTVFVNTNAAKSFYVLPNTSQAAKVYKKEAHLWVSSIGNQQKYYSADQITLGPTDSNDPNHVEGLGWNGIVEFIYSSGIWTQLIHNINLTPDPNV